MTEAVTQLERLSRSVNADEVLSPTLASDYLKSLKFDDWGRLKPRTLEMTGNDYQKVWKRLSGNV